MHPPCLPPIKNNLPVPQNKLQGFYKSLKDSIIFYLKGRSNAETLKNTLTIQ